MYKKFFMGIAAMAALTLVSCSSDDLNSLSDNSSKNEAISFDGYLGRSAVAVNGSRGSVLEIDDLRKSSEGFGVFGNYNSTGGQKFGFNLFNNQKVTGKASAEGTKWTWTYDPVKYWPTDGHIDFLAYAPRVDNKQLNGSSIDFTVEDDAANQKDLLWANATNQTKANKTVTFKFKHALAKIGYKVQLNGDYTGTTIKLNKITLAGSNDGKGTNKAFYKKGTIDLSYTSSTTTSLWTPSEEKQDFEWYSGDDQLSKTTAVENPKTKYLFVIPQDFSQQTENADKLYVIVEYTISYTNGATATMTSTVSSPIVKNFEQGKAYTINLTIGLTPIEFDATVENWGDIVDYPITLE